jgi:hypothetical protein
MVKCKSPTCVGQAYYGTIFNRPEWCKEHKPTGTGIVKKKCVSVLCSNAALAGDYCLRCAKVYADIDRYRANKLAELAAMIESEAKSSTVGEQAALERRPPAEQQAEVKLATPKKPSPSADQATAKAPKKVGLPEEPAQQPSEKTPLKSRTQTPGRRATLPSLPSA